MCLAAAGALGIDVSVGQWCRADRDLDRFFGKFEPFGHGLGVATILISVWLLDPGRRWAIPRVLTVAAASGLAVDLVKVLVVRVRPSHFDFQGSVWTTFGDWLPLGSAGSAGQSFPSGHTATAVGLAVALAWLYPRGRWLFPTLAALVACQRVETGAHWPSDVLAAAAVGCLVGWCCLGTSPISKAFDRWESRWGGGDLAGRASRAAARLRGGSPDQPEVRMARPSRNRTLHFRCPLPSAPCLLPTAPCPLPGANNRVR